jgi:hypothetical protein
MAGILPTADLPVPGLGQVGRLTAGLPAIVNRVLSGKIFDLVYVKTNVGGYFFDAVFKTQHTSKLRITSHPVQGGANISDHAYMEPLSVTMDIGMSDANPSPILGQFVSAGNKSQSAFDELRKMQESRTPLDVYTRFKAYTNMLIEEISVPDDVKTSTGMRATLMLRQIIMVDVPVVKVSSRPQTTGSTTGGNPVPIKPPPIVARQIEKGLGVK